MLSSQPFHGVSRTCLTGFFILLTTVAHFTQQLFDSVGEDVPVPEVGHDPSSSCIEMVDKVTAIVEDRACCVGDRIEILHVRQRFIMSEDHVAPSVIDRWEVNGQMSRRGGCSVC